VRTRSRPNDNKHCSQRRSGGSYEQSPSTYLRYAGGNAELKPEEGHSFDAGLSFLDHAAAWQAIDVFKRSSTATSSSTTI
jgi:hypothetical protein